MKNLDPIFKAKSVAIIGASDTPGKIGYTIIKNFLGGFKGKVYPVNPKYKKILGLKCYNNISEIKNKIDLVVIAIPAKYCPSALEECGKKKVGGVVIVSGGFAEIGEVELEKELFRVAEKYGIPVIGPNCLGVFDTNSNIDTLFLPKYKLERPEKGSIAFISQSGAVGSVVLDWAGAKEFGVSKFVSYGNALNVDEVDLIEYLGKDPKTKIICSYMEGTKRGKALMKAAKKVGCNKPIIALKVGRSEEGAKAVSSHTGSLAGSDRVWDAAFNQCGIIRADGLDDMFNFTRVLAEQPLPKGKRVAIVTNGGGFGVLATDACKKYGLELADLSKKTLNKIKKNVPSYAVIKNPVDLVGDADVERYKITLNSLIEDNKVDMILCIILFQTAPIDSDVIEVASEISDKKKKPIVVATAGGEYSMLHSKILEESGIPTFNNLEDAAKALSILEDYKGFKNSKACRI